MITFWKTLIYLMLQIKLSDTQPFPKDPNSILASTPQYFKNITPLLIADKDLSPLPKETYKIGKEYVNKPDINIPEKHTINNISKSFNLVFNLILLYLH